MRPVVLATLLAAALLSAACATESTPPEAAPPLVEICFDPSPDERALATMWVTNIAARPATITRVETLDATGMRLSAPVVVDDPDGTIPTGEELPPHDPRALAIWEQRTAAIGASIAPGATIRVIQPMRAHAPDAGFTRMRVTIQSGNDTTRHENSTSARIADAAGNCD